MNVDWLLDCDPRPAQIEALRRSYLGYRCQDTKHDPVSPIPLAHAGRPARGWGHFMEMRVGKTPTALNEQMLFKRDYGLVKGFMLSPNKYKYTWGKEAVKFGMDIPVFVFESKSRKEFERFMTLQTEGFVVANYEALGYEDNLKMFEKWIDDKTYMGADESVMMKNPNSSFFKNALALSKDAAVTRPLTGLPSPQGPFDLWAQLRFARHLNGFDFHAFKHTYTKMGGFKNKQAKGLKPDKEQDLHDLLATCCFKARRVDWGTKIESDYERVPLDMLPDQKRAYDEMEREFVLWLNETDSVAVDQVITKRMKMQQISSGFIIDEEGVVRDIVPFHKTPKFVDLLERLDTQIPGKTIIIAHYSATIRRLADALASKYPAVICGGKNMKEMGLDVEEEKTRFNNDPKCRVVVGQSQAIKYGHTLMGNPQDPCLSIGFFENNYSLDNRAQSEERPQGEGQQDAIHIWDYYSSGVERDIIEALQKKKSLAEAIMGHYNNKHE